jgi:hypothetical protein
MIKKLIWIAILIGILWLVFLSGCDNSRPYTKVDTLSDQNSIKDVVIKEIEVTKWKEKITIAYRNIGWVQVAMILLTVAGLMLIILDSPKLGLSCLCGGALGNTLVAANIWHPEWMAGIGIAVCAAAGGGYALYRLIIWSKGTKVVAVNVDKLKGILTPEQLAQAKIILGENQTPAIEDLFDKLRKKVTNVATT